MSITVLEEKTVTNVTFTDGKNTGVIKLVDGRYERITMPHPVPPEYSKEWFALMREIGDLIIQSEGKHVRTVYQAFASQVMTEEAKAIDDAWFSSENDGKSCKLS